MSRSFGLDAPSALEALKSAVEKFKEDDINKDMARDCAIKAWQLCDHAFIVLGSDSPFVKLEEFQVHVRHTCRELDYLQDICIESKHGKITRDTPQIDRARLHVGDFSREDFSHDFDISRLEIVLPGGQTVFFNDVVDRAVDYWSKFFDDNEIK